MPLIEYMHMYNYEKSAGQKTELIGCTEQTNAFETFIKTGNIRATFCGHDHNNDFHGTLHGITLHYGRKSGYNVYGDLIKGARVITLKENDNFDFSFKSYIVEDDGKIVKQNKYKYQDNFF